ncbi:GNAT family N-acetyltransferase [Actinoplanes sp. TRM 88003]|uniref:GNAT family N-acetyltransferase n=1 Tax=Paractinoplanes aksuensis TaxID=2939490 RepID=A0ABT1DSW7_9ACTN|nr:GNAT family N-acetyltransferase [Actinoplanes aksuensis]MCO8273085.1 GNAT family N-acetyltransferase [Actinoplanes aksuensis]
MIVRERRDDDLGRCVDALRLVHAADAYPLNWPHDPRAWLAPADAAWVAVAADGTIAGHVAVRERELCRLFVIPGEHRGRSVGRALVARARAWAAEHGHGLTLNVVDEQRSAAVAFYEATGWRFTHVTAADWTGPDGQPVQLRHYEVG